MKLICFECDKFTGTNIHCKNDCPKLKASLAVVDRNDYPPTYLNTSEPKDPKREVNVPASHLNIVPITWSRKSLAY